MEDGLSRMQLDQGVIRETFWAVAEERFNNDSVDSKLNLRGRLDEVDANARPLSIRSTAKLK